MNSKKNIENEQTIRLCGTMLYPLIEFQKTIESDIANFQTQSFSISEQLNINVVNFNKLTNCLLKFKKSLEDIFRYMDTRDKYIPISMIDTYIGRLGKVYGEFMDISIAFLENTKLIEAYTSNKKIQEIIPLTQNIVEYCDHYLEVLDALRTTYKRFHNQCYYN